MSRTTPLRKVNKRIWPLWICPILILHAPFNQVIWMDCDVVVLRELANLFAAINEGPVFTPENKAPQCTPNSPELYELLPIRRAFNPLSPAVNAGVSGWRKDRDAEALAAYILPVERAIDDARLRDALSWHDQGALIWAIQCQGLEDRVSPSRTWNLCADHTSLLQRPIPWDSDFLPKARAKVRNANILHWNGSEPPWVTGSV